MPVLVYERVLPDELGNGLEDGGGRLHDPELRILEPRLLVALKTRGRQSTACCTAMIFLKFIRRAPVCLSSLHCETRQLIFGLINAKCRCNSGTRLERACPGLIPPQIILIPPPMAIFSPSIVVAVARIAIVILGDHPVALVIRQHRDRCGHCAQDNRDCAKKHASQVQNSELMRPPCRPR